MIATPETLRQLIRQTNGHRLQVEISVYLATVAHGCDGDDAGVIIHGIDHAVIASAHARVRPTTGQVRETRRAWAVARLSITWPTVFRTGGSSCLSDQRARAGLRSCRRPRQALLQIKLCFELLPGDRLAGLVHGRVSLRGVFGVLGRAKSLDH